MRSAVLVLLLVTACAAPNGADSPKQSESIAQSRFEVQPLQFADASELARTLTQLQNAQHSAALQAAGSENKTSVPPAITVMCDPRTNSLLIMAPPGTDIELTRLLDLIKQLDVKVQK